LDRSEQNDKHEKTVLCFFRSYLSVLLPRLLAEDKDIRGACTSFRPYEEERNIVALGQKVVLNWEIKQGSGARRGSPMLAGAEDMRSLTGFDFSPDLPRDRFLPEFRDVPSADCRRQFRPVSREFLQPPIAGFLSGAGCAFSRPLRCCICARRNDPVRFSGKHLFPAAFYFTHTIIWSIPVRRVVPEEAGCGMVR